MKRFEGRNAVVTGGASGIGNAVTSRLISEGAHVTVWDLDTDALTNFDASKVNGSVVNLTDADAVYAARDAVLAARGGIDILVCSAGITGPNCPISEYSEEAWKTVFDVNMHGLFYSNKAVIPAMTDAGYGRIVNIASVAGKEGNPNASAYSASKAAVIGFTKSLGKELATTGVAANVVTPAAAKTAIFDQMSEEHIAYMLSKIPMGRFGQVDEMASMVAWLCSEECSFSTGAVFDITGGRSVY